MNVVEPCGRACFWCARSSREKDRRCHIHHRTVSTSPPRSRSPPPEGGSASHQLRTYVRTYVRIRIWNFAWGFSKYTYVPYVRTYVYFLKPQDVPNGTHVRIIAHGRRSITRTYLPFHLRTYLHVRTVPPCTYARTYVRTHVRTHLRTVRTYRFTHVLYIPYRTHIYVRIVSPRESSACSTSFLYNLHWRSHKIAESGFCTHPR